MGGRLWLVLGAIFGAIAVAAGAFGAHLLEGRLEEKALRSFEVAVRYQMVHALALVLVGALARQQPSAGLTFAGGAFVAGTILFSGGLYAWVFTEVKLFVAIVPVGGLAFIIGWIALAWTALRGGAVGGP